MKSHMDHTKANAYIGRRCFNSVIDELITSCQNIQTVFHFLPIYTYKFSYRIFCIHYTNDVTQISHIYLTKKETLYDI